MRGLVRRKGRQAEGESRTLIEERDVERRQKVRTWTEREREPNPEIESLLQAGAKY